MVFELLLHSKHSTLAVFTRILYCARGRLVLLAARRRTSISMAPLRSLWCTGVRIPRRLTSQLRKPSDSRSQRVGSGQTTFTDFRLFGKTIQTGLCFGTCHSVLKDARHALIGSKASV